MDTADEMNEKSKVAARSPFVVVLISESARVLIDFCSDAIPLGATAPAIRFFVLKADIDVVPLGC